MRYGSSTVTEVWGDPKTLRELKEFVRIAEHAWFSDEAALEWNEDCLFFRRTDFQKSWTQMELDIEVGEDPWHPSNPAPRKGKREYTLEDAWEEWRDSNGYR